MLWYCRSLLLIAFVLSFWAKKKFVIYLSGDTSWFCGLPFPSREINSLYGVSLNWGNLAANLAIFALLYAALTIIFTCGKPWMQRLSGWWLTALLIGISGNLWIHFARPPYPLLMLLLFYGYAFFSNLCALSILMRSTQKNDNSPPHDQV